MSEQVVSIQKAIPFLRLYASGTLTRTAANSDAYAIATKQQWAMLSRRSNTILLTEFGKTKLEDYLNNTWPDWREYLAELQESELPISLEGVKELARRKRAVDVSLPERAHHKTICAALGTHSKTGIGQRMSALVGATEVTTDQVLRIRANTGLIIRSRGYEISADLLMAVFGEVVLPERVFLDGLEFAGVLPKAALTVENLGSYVDLPPLPSHAIVIHVPGRNTALTIKALDLLPEAMPILHFGDLDPKGLEVADYLVAACKQQTRLFVPTFWEESINLLTGFKEWPEQVSIFEDIPVIARLKKEGRWLEQERIALDGRLAEELRCELSHIVTIIR